MCGRVVLELPGALCLAQDLPATAQVKLVQRVEFCGSNSYSQWQRFDRQGGCFLWLALPCRQTFLEQQFRSARLAFGLWF
jgi:hypothetical protein